MMRITQEFNENISSFETGMNAYYEDLMQDPVIGAAFPRMILSAGMQPGQLIAIECHLNLFDSGVYESGIEPVSITVSPIAPQPVASILPTNTLTPLGNSETERCTFTFGQRRFAEPVNCPQGLQINAFQVRFPRFLSKPAPANPVVRGVVTFVFN